MAGGAREEREEKPKNLNIRVENLQENLRDFKLSFAAEVYPERSRRASSR